jgi:hypothetical protein
MSRLVAAKVEGVEYSHWRRHWDKMAGRLGFMRISISSPASIVAVLWITLSCVGSGLPVHAAASFIEIQIPSHRTVVSTINSSGAVAGFYGGYDGREEGSFVRAADGIITTFEVPGELYTGAMSMNNGGAITGNYFNLDNVSHGFLRTADGTLTTFDVSGAGTKQGQGTTPSGINDKGVIGSCPDEWCRSCG